MKKQILKTIFLFLLIFCLLIPALPVKAWFIFPDPVIIIPGIGASWNWGIMYNWRMGDSGWDFFPGVKNYDSLIQAFEDNSFYQRDSNLFVCFYDWRKSNQDSAKNFLKPLIDQVKAKTGFDKVDIVAHSMGGLVARAYIQSDDYENDVDQLITLATPHRGSSDVYTVWEGGYIPENWEGFLKHGLRFYLWYTSIQNATYNNYITVHNNIPSVRELMPVYDYLQDKNTGQIKSYQQIVEKNIFLQNLNTQENINLLQSRVKFINIAGQNQLTVNQIPVADAFEESPLWIDGKPEPIDPLANDNQGDNRVLLSSGFLITSTAQIVTLAARHGNIPHSSIPFVFQELGLDLNGFPDPPPYYANYLTYYLASPVEIKVTDPLARVITRNSNNIPQAVYEAEDDPKGLKMILIPNPLPGDYQIELKGLDNGDFHLGFGYFADNQGTRFQEIQGSISLDKIQNFSLNLAIDEEGQKANLIITDPFLTSLASDIIIKEVMANALDEDSGEFVELFNKGNTLVDLNNWNLADNNDTNDYLVDYTGVYDWGLAGTLLPASGLALVVDPDYLGQYNEYLSQNANPNKVIMLTIDQDKALGNGLANSGDRISLTAKDGSYSTSFSWASDAGNGKSFEKTDPYQDPDSNDSSNWHISLDSFGSTPGRGNSGLSRNLPSTNQPPQATIIATPVQGTAPLRVDFDASGSSDPEKGPLTFAWDFGDPDSGVVNTSPQITTTHTYLTAGAYAVNLIVTDNQGLTGLAQTMIMVTTLAQIITKPAESDEKSSFSGAGFISVFNKARAPLISRQITKNITSQSITITWQTDHPTTSRVVYDIVSHPELEGPPSYGYAFSSPEQDSKQKVFFHLVALTGLAPGTTYYYRTISHGSPETVSEEKTFKTLENQVDLPIFTDEKDEEGENELTISNQVLGEDREQAIEEITTANLEPEKDLTLDEEEFMDDEEFIDDEESAEKEGSDVSPEKSIRNSIATNFLSAGFTLLKKWQFWPLFFLFIICLIFLIERSEGKNRN